jgi:hypothetical protein
MSKNLGLRFSHPDAASHLVRYRRIDNNPGAPFIGVSPNPVSSPAVIATDVPNGQYEIESTPVYADGRPCSPSLVYTDGCPVLLAINAYMSGNNLVIDYTAPPGAPKVRISVSYPNGGGSIANYVNTGNSIVLPVPSNVFGDIVVSGQTVCDETSGFYSDGSQSVTVNRAATNLSIFNNANGITLTAVTGITGYTLPQFIAYGETQNGSHQAFFGGFTVGFSGTPAANSSAQLLLNGTQIQCVNVPNTNGGTISFSAVSFAATDVIAVNIVPGLCANPAITGAYRLGADESAACAASPTVLYSAAPLGTGIVMYTNIARTNPLTGFPIIIATNGTGYNINSGTGEVGSPTGNNC